MIFSTCGFQSGALEFAEAYGIAAVAFVNGTFLYETRGASPPGPPPPWAGSPDYAGILMGKKDGKISCSTIDLRNVDVLSNWLRSSRSYLISVCPRRARKTRGPTKQVRATPFFPELRNQETRCRQCSWKASPNWAVSMASSFLALIQKPSTIKATPTTHRHWSMAKAPPTAAKSSPE